MRIDCSCWFRKRANESKGGKGVDTSPRSALETCGTGVISHAPRLLPNGEILQQSQSKGQSGESANNNQLANSLRTR